MAVRLHNVPMLASPATPFQRPALDDRGRLQLRRRVAGRPSLSAPGQGVPRERPRGRRAGNLRLQVRWETRGPRQNEGRERTEAGVDAGPRRGRDAPHRHPGAGGRLPVALRPGVAVVSAGRAGAAAPLRKGLHAGQRRQPIPLLCFGELHSVSIAGRTSRQ